MTLDRDPLDILARLAPPAADPAHLRRLAARTAHLRSAPAQRRRSLRGPAVVVAALALSAGSVGLATAGDPAPVPVPLGDLASHWGEHNPWGGQPVGPADAERVGSVPFADGLVFSVWSAQSTAGDVCFATALERTSDATPAGTPPDESIGGTRAGCQPAADGLGELTLLSATTVDDQETFFEVALGDAVRATLTLPDGSVQELLTAADTSFGWLPTTTASGVVTGYLGDGTAAETITVHR